jgi:hypothetical protein
MLRRFAARSAQSAFSPSTNSLQGAAMHFMPVTRFAAMRPQQIAPVKAKSSMSIAQQFSLAGTSFAFAPGVLDMEVVGTTEIPYVWGLFSLALLGGVTAAGPFPVIQYENKVFAGGMGGREQEGPASTWPALTAIMLPLFLGSFSDLAMGTWSYIFWLSALGFIGLWAAQPPERYGFHHYFLGKNQTPISIATRWLTGFSWILRLPLRVGWAQFLIGFRLTVNVLRILNSFLLLSVGLETIITIVELVLFNFTLWGPVDWLFWYFCYLSVAYAKGLLLILHMRLMITLSTVWLHPGRYMNNIKLITGAGAAGTHDDHHH